MKGQDLPLNLIGYVLIGIIGIIVLIFFLQGPLTQLMTNTFCYFYQNVLGQQSSLCKKNVGSINTEYLSEDTTEGLARWIAVYSITCSRMSLQLSKDIVCYDLILQKNPGKVSELMVTQLMENEGGCQALQNSRIVFENGTYGNYPGDCGTRDDLVWNVTGNVIDQQSIVLIKYDISLGKITVEA